MQRDRTVNKSARPLGTFLSRAHPNARADRGAAKNGSLASRVSRRSGMHPRHQSPNFIYEIETWWTSLEWRPERGAHSRQSHRNPVLRFDRIAIGLSESRGGKLFLQFSADQL